MLSRTTGTLVHASRGRLRIRFPLLKSNPCLASRLETALGNVAGIREVKPSVRTGSLLILYDPITLALPENGGKLIGSLSELVPGFVDSNAVRFMLPGSKNSMLIERLRAGLGPELGVERVVVAPSGEVTVSYDPARLDVVKVLQALLSVAQNRKQDVVG